MSSQDGSSPNPYDPPPVEWLGPPLDVVGGLVPRAIRLIATERLGLVMERVQVYPGGLTFVIRAVLRDERTGMDRPGRAFWEPRGPGRELQIKVDYGDGRQATKRGWPHRRSDVDLEMPRVIELRETGDFRGYERSYWTAPDPPRSVIFTVSWPMMEVPAVSVELTHAELEDARSRIWEIW